MLYEPARLYEVPSASVLAAACAQQVQAVAAVAEQLVHGTHGWLGKLRAALGRTWLRQMWHHMRRSRQHGSLVHCAEGDSSQCNAA